MLNFKFNGRPDGLGNRIEQLILLEAYCNRNKCKCNYYWNNLYKYRTYDIHIKCKNITIQKNQRHAKSEIALHTIMYSNEEINNACQNINFTFDLPWLDFKYHSVHIRSTDKLNNRGKDEFTWDTLWDSINKCINIINTNMDVMNYIIVADDDDIKTKFQKNINPKVNVINIPYDNIYPKEYIDLYILSKSDLIYMVPKFSSFSTTASLLGSTKLYSFFDENETSLYRYHANILKH